MASRWLLDTSALLALRDDKPGADRVARLLQAARNGDSHCLVCFMSRMEPKTNDGPASPMPSCRPCRLSGYRPAMRCCSRLRPSRPATRFP